MCDRKEELKSVIKSADCLKVVKELEVCMAANDRKWNFCQEQVKALKLCKAAEEKARDNVHYVINSAPSQK